MSDQRAGERTRSTKVAATIAGLLCAPPVGAFLANCFVVIYLHATTEGPVIVGPTSATLTFALPIMYGAYFGWPIAFLIGWPVHILLQLQRANSALHYSIFGAAIGWILLPVAFIAGALTGLLGLIALGFGLAGAIGGLIFWLIRRPDRDTRPSLTAVQKDPKA